MHRICSKSIPHKYLVSYFLNGRLLQTSSTHHCCKTKHLCWKLYTICYVFLTVMKSTLLNGLLNVVSSCWLVLKFACLEFQTKLTKFLLNHSNLFWGPFLSRDSVVGMSMRISGQIGRKSEWSITI